MILHPNTTADERGLIADAVCPIMLNVENVLGELDDIQEEYFADAEQKPINVRDAKRIGRIIRISTDLLGDACAAFGLLTGFDEWYGTKATLNQMERISCARRVEALRDQLYAKEKYMSEEKREQMAEARRNAEGMPEEQAETVLAALLKGV